MYNNSHFCQVCETWSHAKYNSIESKNIRDVYKASGVISLNNKSKSDISLQIGNSVSSDPKLISETFNSFFSNVASNL